MLTVEMLEKMPEGTIFATGTDMDLPDGIYLAGTGRELRWCAVRGGAPDWCIYCYFSEKEIHWIKRFGDKVCSERHIRKLVPCDDEAMKRYRY